MTQCVMRDSETAVQCGAKATVEVRITYLPDWSAHVCEAHALDPKLWQSLTYRFNSYRTKAEFQLSLPSA